MKKKHVLSLLAVLVAAAATAVGAAAHNGPHATSTLTAQTDAATLWSPSSYLTRSAPAQARKLAATRPLVDVQILDLSDWHGQLDPLDISGVGQVGGAAQLSSYFKADRLANPNTLTLTAGDDFGAAPPLSGFFNEEPAVKAENLMGIEVNTFGNHNFDKGIAHLQSMVDLAEFPYVSANLRNLEDNLDGVAPWTIIQKGGVAIGVVGITNPEAPTLVFPGSFGTIVPTDPVPAANRARAAAQAAGAEVTVAITHMGVTSFDPITGAAQGPLIDFANAVGGFDVIFGDHTDVQYVGMHNGHLVVENKSKGATYSKTLLKVDPANGRIDSIGHQFVVPRSSAVTPDPAIVAMLAPYRTALAAQLDGVIGVATGLFPRGGSPAVERVGEVAVGNLVTDALRTTYGTQIAFTNGGGLRSPLPSSYAPADHTLRRTTPGYAPGPPYDLVIGDVYTLLPFGNQSLTRAVTGAQLWAALNHSVSSIPAANGKFLQISGFKFSYSASAPAGSRVVSVELSDGTPIPNDASFLLTATTNDFTNAGGDGYTMLADGTGVTRNLMANDVLAYIRAAGTITPAMEGRITKLP